MTSHCKSMSIINAALLLQTKQTYANVSISPFPSWKIEAAILQWATTKALKIVPFGQCPRVRARLCHQKHLNNLG